jgi:hypothetical protein
MKLTLLVCLAGLLLPAGSLAQAPIRVDVSLVNVGFSVQDDRGNLVAI